MNRNNFKTWLVGGSMALALFVGTTVWAQVKKDQTPVQKTNIIKVSDQKPQKKKQQKRNLSKVVVDSSKKKWVTVDGKNFNAEVETKKIPHIEMLALKREEWQREQTINRLKKNVHLYKAIYSDPSEVQAQKEPLKWDPSRIGKVQRHTKIWNTSPLSGIIRDKNGIIYQIDSNDIVWHTLDEKNWNKRVEQ